VRLGDALGTLSRQIGLTNEDIDALDRSRDRSVAQPLRFE
jgi:hypothetical protein